MANRHPRVNILQPGPGVGGHCIAVDPWFIVNSVPDVARLIATARQVNDAKLEHVYERARAALKHENGKSLVCLGITFKADVDDLRESPALKITERLAHEFGDRIMVVEPNVRELPDPLKSLGVHHVSFRDARRSCGIFLLLVDHEEFRRVPISELQGKVVIDTRGIWRDDRRKPPS